MNCEFQAAAIFCPLCCALCPLTMCPYQCKMPKLKLIDRNVTLRTTQPEFTYIRQLTLQSYESRQHHHHLMIIIIIIIITTMTMMHRTAGNCHRDASVPALLSLLSSNLLHALLVQVGQLILLGNWLIIIIMIMMMIIIIVSDIVFKVFGVHQQVTGSFLFTEKLCTLIQVNGQ